ncbi:MAG: hypothetical protein LBE22_10370 [Azoarcus sp.]|jgi:hypothetical protein|nr:hypothetical protein [Azoarcus sp.]
MTIMSKQNSLSYNQTIAAATVTSENIIDLGSTLDGTFDKAWNGIPFLAQVTANIIGATGMNLVLQTSDTEAFTTPVTVATIPFNGVTAGSRAIYRELPYGVTKRYLRAQYTATGGTPTAGTVTAGFTTGNEEIPPA